MKEIFKKEEEMLNNYPKEWSKNYYQNKETLKIKFKDSILDNDSICGQYISEKNTIEVLVKEVIYHELSHMAFNDKTKYKKQIDENLYYANGVSIIINKDNIKKINFNAINEGFAEYLARKNTSIQGQHINYYFANMLIKIYGEDLLKYPLTNDPIGFISDKRFYDIKKFLDNLDHLNKYFNYIMVANNVEKRKNEFDIKKIKKQIIIAYNAYIVETFDSLYNEFKNSCNSLIDIEEYNELINEFYNYDLFSTFNNKKCNIKKYLKSYK